MAKKAAIHPAKKAEKRTAAIAPRDDGEDVHLMEPMRISEENSARPDLTELVLELPSDPPRFGQAFARG